MQTRKVLLAAVSLLLTAWVMVPSRAETRQAEPPNILLIILDDVGIDLFQSFGFGGGEASRTPAMDTISSGGLRFRNAWSMPECSPTRAAILTGRYPLRTNTTAALVPGDLANSQLSPFEMTIPKVLKHAGYTSALFGKWHSTDGATYPYGDNGPLSVGFDYFYGPLSGSRGLALPAIDTTAGGIAYDDRGTSAQPHGPYSCGFIPNASADPVYGADSGACYFADGRSCTELTKTAAEPHPGRACLEQGGILDPNAVCQSPAPDKLRWDLPNAYYVEPLCETDMDTSQVTEVPLTDRRARTYSATEYTNAAIEWIRAHPTGPWMAAVNYFNDHVPQQPAPQSLTPGWEDVGGLPCDGTTDISEQMLQAADTEIGRLLVETGLASLASSGEIEYRPEASNTMIVILGDNGSYPFVRPPFDASRAKGTTYQTGVWVPLTVAGPLVDSPGRDVESMVNVVDLFELFGEIAGLDVRTIVPSSRTLDSVPMLPYLTQPGIESIRQYNFAQNTTNNLIADNKRPGPCVVSVGAAGKLCMQLYPTRDGCVGFEGTWYGDEYSSCCEVKNRVEGMENLILRTVAQAAVRNDTFKLVQTTSEDCSILNGTSTAYEFYEINQDASSPALDRREKNLIISQSSPTQGLTEEQARNFLLLEDELNRILTSKVLCPGDGNEDGVVDIEDVRNWLSFTKLPLPDGEGSSWYDFPIVNPDGTYVYDGKTDLSDLQVILDNFGLTCPRP